MNENQDLSETGDSGSASPVTPELLERLKGSLKAIVSAVGTYYGAERCRALDTFLARWDGQSDDGRKHADDMGGEDPLPFEGASDSRVRLADRVVRVHRRRLMAVVDRVAVGANGASGAERADMMGELFEYQRRNALGVEWRREWQRFANRYLIEHPAACVMGVYWRREEALVPREFDTVRLAELVLSTGGAADPVEAAAVVQAMLFDPAQAEGTLAWLRSVFPRVRDKMLKRALLTLAKGGVAVLPVPEVVRNAPCIVAHGLFREIFIKPGLKDFQQAPEVFRHEWVTKVELLRRGESEGYAGGFVDEVLKHEGKCSVDWLVDDVRGIVGDTADALRVKRAGMYEVITAYYRAVNEDGVPAIYTVVFNGAVEVAAKDREILDYKHGKYPFAFGAREALEDDILESRGIPSIVLSDQSTLKLLDDSLNDHTQLTCVPPVIVSHNRPDFRLTFGPLEIIKSYRADDVKWMAPPAYPTTNDAHEERVRKRVNEYFSIPGEGVSAEDIQEGLQELVGDWLPVVCEVALQIVQLSQQYMTDEEIVRITGGDGKPIARTVAEIQGQPDLVAEFDARTLDLAWLKTMCEVVGTYLIPWDTEGAIPRTDLVRYVAGKLDRGLGRMVRRSEDVAKSELDNEDTVFAQMMAGIQPPPPVEGQNYAARLGRLKQNIGINPELNGRSPGKVTPVSAALIQARMEQLENLVQQQRNAITGKTMFQPVLGAAA